MLHNSFVRLRKPIIFRAVLGQTEMLPPLRIFQGFNQKIGVCRSHRCGPDTARKDSNRNRSGFMSCPHIMFGVTQDDYFISSKPSPQMGFRVPLSLFDAFLDQFC